MDRTKISEVTPWVYRGPRPDTAEDLEFLKKLGIKCIINLQMRGETVNVMTAEVGNKIFAWELEQRAIFPPSKAHVEMCLRIFEDRDMKPIYVHCHEGKDRTGFVVAKYRISAGWTKLASTREMFDMGMHFWFWWWAFFL